MMFFCIIKNNKTPYDWEKSFIKFSILEKSLYELESFENMMYVNEEILRTLSANDFKLYLSFLKSESPLLNKSADPYCDYIKKAYIEIQKYINENNKKIDETSSELNNNLFDSLIEKVKINDDIFNSLNKNLYYVGIKKLVAFFILCDYILDDGKGESTTISGFLKKKKNDGEEYQNARAEIMGQLKGVPLDNLISLAWTWLEEWKHYRENKYNDIRKLFNNIDYIYSNRSKLCFNLQRVSVSGKIEIKKGIEEKNINLINNLYSLTDNYIDFRFIYNFKNEFAPIISADDNKSTIIPNNEFLKVDTSNFENLDPQKIKYKEYIDLIEEETKIARYPEVNDSIEKYMNILVIAHKNLSNIFNWFKYFIKNIIE